jgi:glucosylceramidase
MNGMRMVVTQAKDDDSGLLHCMEEIEVPGEAAPISGRSSAESTTATAGVPVDSLPRIVVDTANLRQRIDGFGASITEATADLWAHAAAEPDQMIRDLFDQVEGIGLSMLRQPIGPSDHVTRPYSFVRRWPDRRLRSLQFGPEEQRILPMLKAAQSASLRGMERGVEQENGRQDARQSAGPTVVRTVMRTATRDATRDAQRDAGQQQRQGLRIIASPWSAPWWMKTNFSVLGRRWAWPHRVGRLRQSYYDAYARYLAAFVRLYRDHGLDVFGLTPVNEPDNAQAIWPSMAMSPEEQAVFIADYLAPELHAEGLDEVNIMCWDHNYSTGRYPDGAFVKRLYAHDDALRAVAGSAWHYYGGASSTMSRIHECWPSKGIWVTEASGGDWGPRNWEAALLRMSSRVIAMLRNWAQCVVLWNVALDTSGGPDYYYLRHDRQHSQNRGLLTVDRANGAVTKNADYYVIGHFGRFVPVGSQCVGSAASRDMPDVQHVAFLTPSNHLVLVVNNGDAAPCRIAVQAEGELWPVELPPRSLSTLVWER